jgi:virulence-associated protein VagC
VLQRRGGSQDVRITDKLALSVQHRIRVRRADDNGSVIGRPTLP